MLQLSARFRLKIPGTKNVYKRNAGVLLLLNDIYNRYRVLQFLTNKQQQDQAIAAVSVTVDELCSRSNYFSSLAYCHNFIRASHAFHECFAPVIPLTTATSTTSPTKLSGDDCNDYIRYSLMCGSAINRLLMSHPVLFPLQVDLVMIPRLGNTNTNKNTNNTHTMTIPQLLQQHDISFETAAIPVMMTAEKKEKKTTTEHNLCDLLERVVEVSTHDHRRVVLVVDRNHQQLIAYKLDPVRAFSSTNSVYYAIFMTQNFLFPLQTATTTANNNDNNKLAQMRGIIQKKYSSEHEDF